MDQRRAAAALFALAACFTCATAAPTASNQTALDLFEAPVEGCYYNFQHYGESDRIMTNEPCLNCTCHNRMLMCYLRVCPFTKPIGQDCTVEKRADQCCPIVTCPDVPVDLLTSTSTSSPAEYGATGLGKMDKYGCSINGKYFPEGAKVPPTPNKPCEHCYCIHNMTTCVMQECTLHVDGCTPIYHKDVCCPIRYSCDHAEDEIPLLDDMTTTVRPTPGFLLTTTTMMPVTQASQNCVHDDKIFFDGALIKTEKACEHCYCMKGDIVCVVQECGTPMENEGKNCTSLPPKQGQCCPDTYICEGDELSTTQFNEETTTLTPPRRFGVEGSGYRNEPDESYTEMSSIGDTEIEGSGEDNLLTTITSLHSDTPPVTSHNVYPYSTEINAVSSEVTTQSDIENENKVLTTEPSVSITSTNENDLKQDIDEEKGLNVMTTVVPSGQPAYTTSVEDLKQKQDTSKDISTTKSPDQYTTLEPTVTPKLNEISEGITEITTKQSLLDDVDNMTPIDEEFIIATKLPEKTDDIENSFEEPLTTFKPANVEESITEQESSETTPKVMTFTEQQTYSTVTTSSLETTTINVQENEILEETLPARIPGEGDCLLGGVTFKNNTSVPSTNKCHISCKCVSSIIKCDPIICTPPLEYMENMNDCQPIYDSPDSCCPTYVCNTKETIAPESHSQMSGTEIPKPIECVGDECRINQESKTTENPVEHSCGENGCQGTEPSVLPQNDLNDCSNGNCDSKKEQTPVSDTQPCDATSGCQVPVIKPCVGENCITKPVVPTDIQDKFETNNKPCNNENECQVPVITPCIGDDCIIDSKLPNNKETDVLDKETKDEQNTCTDENCRRKEYDETKANVPCSGTDCTQQETVSPNDVTSPESVQPIPTTKPDQAKQPEDFTLSEPRSTLEPFIETTVPSITTSSEIKHTVETIREESTTQTYLVDEGLISHQPDRHSEADKPSTEPSVPDIETVTSSIFDLSTVKEHLVIATEQATTEYSSKPSDENIMHTTLGASLDEINSPSTTEMADKTEIRTEAVSKENTKDTYNMLTEYPKLESTTADTMVSSQSDKESNQNEFIHVTGPPNVDEKTTSSEILEEEKITIAPHLSSSIPYDDRSSDTTESELSFTKEIPDLDLSVQPISHVTGAPDFISEHPTTEQKENYPSTLTPEAFTENADEPTHPEIYAISTEVSKKEEHDFVSPDVPTVTEAQVIEEATEIFNKEGTTFQPESHKHSEPEITSPSTIEENQTQKAIDQDIPELFTEVSPATEFNRNDSQKDQSEIEQVDLTSTDKQETQTKIPEIKYTEVTQDFTTALNENPTEDNTSDMRKDIEQNTETLATIAPLIEDEKITTSAESIESNESPSENPVVHKETTTLRVNEPSGYTTSKPIEDTYTNKFEHSDISEETTIISLPNISESSSNELVDNEIGQSTESIKESKPEILVTDEIEKDEMTISNTDKPYTTLLDEPVDTMKPHESTESSVNNDLGQTHGIEIVKLPSTLPNIIPEVLETDKTFVSTSESTFDPESGLSSTASAIAVELEQETKASTDSSETQEKQTLSPMSLITEKPHTVTESVTENLQTIAVTKTKESELTTGVEITTAGKDLLTTKQNADTVTPSIESTSRIKDSDVTTESPKEETTSKASQSLDESVLGAITEQPGTTFDELTTRSEIEMTSSSKTQKTEAQVDVSTKPSVLTSETHDATDYPILIEEKTKQPELFTTELMIESTKKSDQITEQPLSISTDPQEITMSSVDEHRLSNSQDEISTTVVVENEPEKFTIAPELPLITNDADTIQEETPKQEIDSTKHRDPEGSTETSYETHTKPTTVKEETFVPTQHDILSQDTTDKTLSTESLQSVTPEQTATKSPIENTRFDSISSTLTDTTGISTERALADKIDIQEATTESKYEYSETTPYFVELEEHTHQIMQETSIIPIDESSTERATGIQSTERGDQPLSDNLDNGLQTEKSTDVTVTPLGYSQETTLSNIDVYTTTASEISSSSEPQKDTEVREQDKLEPTDEGIESTVSPTQTSSMIQNEDNLASIPLETKIPDLEITATTEKSHTVMNEESQKPDVLSETKIPDQFTKTTTPHYVHEEITSVKTTLFDEKLIETSSTTSKPITTKPDDQPTEEIPSPEFPPSGVSGYGQEPDYGEEEQAVIPGICRYGGKVYGSTQQIPRDDPCDFCFCFRSDIICLQQSCPPPIHGCREEPIQGFCCPRYECPVSMATTLNVTTTTTTTTTTLPPHFLPHAYKGAAQRRGCHIKGHTYKVGEVVRASSGPCLHCTCGGDGQMKCDPKACTPEPMLRQMIAAAVSARRR
ncbi:unnamed protein product [Pieris macdunnoughi]|uniref:VWFC domain-containing protein n=1 Tax=Pieris macdunnoughi TaxID=345717 RepID=A0A821MRP3_9NEOP|nr:unnamed protein product [Pieris macdunnoughi]